MYFYLANESLLASAILYTKAILIVGALAGSKEGANYFMDLVIDEQLPRFVMEKYLDPKTLAGFVVKVKSTSWTNRDFKAEFKPGMLHGLSSIPRRKGDCGIPSLQGTNVTTSCYVSLDGLRIIYNGSATGFDLLGTKKDIRLGLVVENTKALAEATGSPSKYLQLHVVTSAWTGARMHSFTKMLIFLRIC